MTVVNRVTDVIEDNDWKEGTRVTVHFPPDEFIHSQLIDSDTNLVMCLLFTIPRDYEGLQLFLPCSQYISSRVCVISE